MWHECLVVSFFKKKSTQSFKSIIKKNPAALTFVLEA